MDSKLQTVLVTGGAGYIGSTLCRDLLSDGYRVRVLDNLMYEGKSLLGLFNHPNFEFLQGDIRQDEDIKHALQGVQAVIHLAAIVGDIPCKVNPDVAVATNFHSTQRLAKMAANQGTRRFVFASTCSNYGVADTSVLVDENHKLNPISLYAETKIDCEHMLVDMHQSGQLAPVILRFSTGYGISARTRFDLLVNSFTFEALRDGELLLYSKEAWRSYIHVHDMAAILRMALEPPEHAVGGEIFNAGSNNQNYEKSEVVRMIQEQLPHIRVNYAHGGKTDPRSYRVDFTKIENTLGFTPGRTVPDGIREMIAAIQAGILTEQDYQANSLEQYRG